MAGRRTNIALAFLLGIAAATGVVAFGVGTVWVRPVLVAHGLAAVAIIVLSPWKTAIARRGLKRERGGSPLSILLAALVVVTLISGIAHSVFNVIAVGPVTIMQVHVTAAVSAVIAGAVHVWQRPQRFRASELSRRNFLRTGALAGVAAFGYIAVEATTKAAGLPGGKRRFTGSHEQGSFDPPEMPVTSWLNDTPPTLGAAHRLTVPSPTGTREMTMDQLTAFDDHVTATLDCTGGWYATQQWTGVRLDRLLDATGSSVRVVAATGYERRFPMADVGKLLLATHVGGRPLSVGHGAPLRLVAPGRRGFWWVKWVSEIVVDDRPAWWQPPFPLT